MRCQRVGIAVVRAGLLVMAAVALAGCNPVAGSQAPTTTVMTTATVTRIPAASEAFPRWADSPLNQWTSGPSGYGVFAVGDRPRDGLPAAIPPGRYQVRVSPGATEGAWMRCGTPLCGMAFQQNAVAVGHAIGPDFVTTVDITAEDRAVWVYNVVLAPA